jgi:hypothetical protein
MKAGAVRRSSSSAIVSIVKHFPNNKEITYFTAQLLQKMNENSMILSPVLNYILL